MTQPLRIRLPGVLLAALLAGGCGDREAEQVAPGDAPVAVDPRALEAPVAPADDAALEEPVDVAEWTPALPPVAASDVRRALRDARQLQDEGKLIAATPADVAAAVDDDAPGAGTPTDATDATNAADESDAHAGDVPAGAAPVTAGPPPGALEHYLAVLAVDAENEDALAGVTAIADELLRRGEAARVQGRLHAALRLQRVIERASPRHPELAAYRERVAAARRALDLVREGERRASAGRILRPEGEGAVAAYREALKAVPGFVPARDGLARVLSARLNDALAAAHEGDYVRAETLLAEAARIDAQSPALQDMAARVVELRRQRSALLVAQGHAAVDVLDLELATRRLREAERVSMQGLGLDELAQRIELARHYGRFRPGQELRDPLAGGGDGPEMIVLAHGTFTMGSPDDEADRQDAEGPARPVTFARGFAIARTETTVGDYARFVRATGYRGVATRAGRSTIYDERAGTMAEREGVDWRHAYDGTVAAPAMPVLHVAFEDAEAYAAWLSAQTGERYRLPSEAEFEYALRGGRDEAHPWGVGVPPRVVGNLTGDGDRSPSGRAWANAIPRYDDGHWGPAPVRSYPAEAFGTFDLVGNASEWVLDCWHDGYLRAPADGSAWVNPGCAERVSRGASWASTLDRARSAWRQATPVATTNARTGFRVVREL